MTEAATEPPVAPVATSAAQDVDAVVVIGAGPAGLTAAYQLAVAGRLALVLEADDVVGGISRTVERNGWRFDIGGHRFFTKVPQVEELWRTLLPGDELQVRQRRSRIFYGGRFFDYPLRAGNALANLGLWEAARCVASYARARIRPPRDQSTFEGWVSARFGDRLYRTFFKTYTEKVWGIPATEIRSDWAAQRIKNLSLGTAVLRSLLPRRRRTDVTSLIEEFLYPPLGPGAMWERCREVVEGAGTKVLMSTEVVAIRRSADGATEVVAETDGVATTYPCSAVISSMPLAELVLAMDPPAPQHVQDAARGLAHRDFLSVALVVPEGTAFPDNWIYIHSPEVRLGRVQNFGAWSPAMVKPGWTCLGLEYFAFEGDDLWTMDDAQLVAFATAELAGLGLVDAADIVEGHVVRMPKAYPTYDEGYAERVATLAAWLGSELPNVQPIGRNGMHRYNNQDHSMWTAMLAVENLLDGADHDLWSVNVEAEYHEEVRAPSAPTGTGTGRGAPTRLRPP